MLHLVQLPVKCVKKTNYLATQPAFTNLLLELKRGTDSTLMPMDLKWYVIKTLIGVLCWCLHTFVHIVYVCLTCSYLRFPTLVPAHFCGFLSSTPPSTQEGLLNPRWFTNSQANSYIRGYKAVNDNK